VCLLLLVRPDRNMQLRGTPADLRTPAGSRVQGGGTPTRLSPLHPDATMTAWLVALVLACSAFFLGWLLLAGQLVR